MSYAYLTACATITSTLADSALARHSTAVGVPMPPPNVPGLPQATRLIILPVRVSALADPRKPLAERSLPPRLIGYSSVDLLDPIKRRLRFRGSGIVDVYRRDNHGFRLSGGGRYHMQYSPPDYGPGAASGTTALMRVPQGAVNLLDGYEWYAPVAMAGYDRFIADRLKVGVEGGMMFGRATGLYGTTTLPDGSADSRTTRNPVGDVVMTYTF